MTTIAGMRIAVDDVRLFFDVEGCGLAVDGPAMAARPTLVLLHGGPGGDHTLFRPEFSAITDLAQVVYLDQRGSGRSDRSEPGQWTWARWADDVAGFCLALGIEAPVLVGTSSGGVVAMRYAARHPGLVGGLVLDSTLGAPMSLRDSLDVFDRRGGAQAADAARRYLGGDTGPEAALAWRQHALPLYGSTADGDMDMRRARALINDDVQQHFRRGGCGPAAIGDHAAAITCPTLILAGQDDPVTPAAGSARLAALLTGTSARVEILDGVGHGVFRQAPQRAFELLRAFLRQIA
jgi:pimeloyl-ACP methyl ester carboxylesterase